MSTNKYDINSIIRAIDILELYSYDNTELGINDMAAALNLYKSTVHRIVSTLEHRKVLEQNPETKKYRMSSTLLRLGFIAQVTNSLITLSKPHLKELMELTGETASLVALEGSKCIYLARQESPRLIKMISQIGSQILPHCSSSGKMLLAGLEEQAVDEIIGVNGLPRFTDNTITDRDKFMAELQTIRQRGYSIDNQEIELGVMCVAAPIRDAKNKIIAAVSVSGPLERMQNRLEEVAVNARNCTKQISYKLGFRDNPEQRYFS